MTETAFNLTAQNWENFIRFKPTEIEAILDSLDYDVIAMFFGNRGGKTSQVARQYVKRLLGIHPIPRKNELAYKIRCMSSSLPTSNIEGDSDNAQYIELKKVIPRELILSDVNTRNQTLVVQRPSGLSSQVTIFEFRSSKQELQDLGKITVDSLWHDEETPKPIREECVMRLMHGGDEVFTVTSINPLTYLYDDIWENKNYLYKSPEIIKELGGLKEEYFKNESKVTIACLHGATDDNPILKPEDIDKQFEGITDPDDKMLRRYSIFKQISGRIHKTYNPKFCYINFKETFPDGIPEGDVTRNMELRQSFRVPWVHARGIDFHPSRTPWSIGWIACSPDDEWFLWQEFHPAIDGPNAYNSYEIAKAIVRMSGDHEYSVNLIDPEAQIKQPNTLFSTVDDLNRYFNDDFKSPALWESWDTKGKKGRDEVGKRFKNAVRCGKPFNNKVKEAGLTKYLPTLWICDTCPETHKSLKNWRYKEHATTNTKIVSDPNLKPQQKNSHDPMVLECLGKDHRLLYASYFAKHRPPIQKHTPRSVTGR